jgi:hypothetical protein
MKKLTLILTLLISLTIFSQEYETEINLIDTINLKKFKCKKVIVYEFENAKICIPTKDYLKRISIVRRNYKESLAESNKDGESFIYLHRNFKIIDSVYKAVQKGIKTKDTIVIKYDIFKKTELGSLINFEYFIENEKCEVYDVNGKTQNKIIRKTESYYIGPENSWSGRRYYLINQKKYFYECTDSIS